MTSKRVLGVASATVILSMGCAGGSEPAASAETSAGGETTVEVVAVPTKVQGEKHMLTHTISGIGLSTPESVVYDASTDSYLISNIQGGPSDQDGKAFISRVTPQGELVKLHWIDSRREGVELNAPKGMAIAGDTLYVADITHVRKFDLATGEPRGSVEFPGATFLNDVAAGPEGVIYVSDSGLLPNFSPSGTDAIYTIAADDTITTLIKGEHLGRPNGLLATAEGVWVVTYGSGEIYKVALDGSKGTSLKLPKGALDGIVRTKSGDLLVSSWEGSSVLAGDGTTFTEAVLDVDAPADIAMDTKRNRVLIPLFKQNALQIVELE